MKNLLFTIALIVSALIIKAQPVPELVGGCSDLFFSELTFGKNPNGNIWDLNYAVEIYNPTPSTISLNNYRLKLTNGIGNSVYLNLSGSIPSGDVHVVANSSSDQNLQSMADELFGGLDFETTVILELENNGNTIDKIGQNGTPTPGSIDIVQLIADPYGYLATFHLDLNDYNNVDIRRSMFVDKGNPTFNSATDVIGKWGYFINVDRTNIGIHTSVCKPTADPIVGFIKLKDTIYHNAAHGQIQCPMALNIVNGTIPWGTTIEHQLVGGPSNWGTGTPSTDGHFTFDPLASSWGNCYYFNSPCGFAKSAQSQTRPSTWTLVKLNAPNGGFIPDVNGTDVTRIDIRQWTPAGLVNINLSDDIQIYPTVTDENIYIDSKVKSNIKIYSSDGKLLNTYSFNIGNSEIFTSHLSSGNYLMHVTDENHNTFYTKFTKQ